MENILEMLYNLPLKNTHEQDPSFVRATRIQCEQLELLIAYLDTRSRVEDMLDFDRFRFAFHVGAQLTAELIRGKGTVTELLDRTGA